MYSDEDGAATKRSQAMYNARMRILLSMTTLLSCLGFVAAVLNGEYSEENFYFPLSLKQRDLLGWSKFLWPLISFHSLSLHWKDNPLGIYTAGLRGSLLSVFIVSSKLLARNLDSREPIFAPSWASTQLYAAVLLAIIQVLFPRRPDLFTPEGKLVDRERSSSALSRYSMYWCSSALVLAGKPVALEELPVLDHFTRSRSQSLITIESPEATLWDRIFAERYTGFVKQWILTFVRSMVTFGSPYCVMRLLKILENNHGRTDDAWIWLIGIGAFSTCQTVINYHLIWIQWSEMGIPIRAQLIMALFRKVLRIKHSTDQEKKDSDASKATSGKPDVINLVSSDTLSFTKFAAVNYIIPSIFIRFSFAVLFLFKLLGWQSTLVGMVAAVLCLPVNTIIIKQQRVAEKNLTAARDKKTKVIAEALNALRQIKFSASETQWEAHIEAFRQEEIKHLRRSFSASNMRSVWGVAAPFIVSAASVYAYTIFQDVVSPSIIFPLIEVLPHLQTTLGFLPVVIQDYMIARSNSSRMEEFLRRPEQKKILDPSASGCVSFHSASIAWPSYVGAEKTERTRENEISTSSLRHFTLDGINLEFPVGELSVISGKTGSGKSLLLAAIIGEVDILSGKISAPSITEGSPVAFVSQTPWLQNATIKENILFGSPFDEERYSKVLAACALQPDLAVLVKGDQTRIGLRGVKLSGGQRTRVAFGRALYSSAQLLVLDDIFSALDSHVSKETFNALTGDLCAGRTRILVTHQVSLCLPKAKYLVHLQNNTVGYAGTIDSIEKVVDVIETEVQLGDKLSIEEKPEVDASNKEPRNKAPATHRARKINARTDLKLYKNYFSAAGGLVFTYVFILGLVAKQLLSALTTWLLGRIKSTHHLEAIADQPEEILVLFDNGLHQYFYMYLASSLLAITLEFLFNLHTYSGSIRASKILFREMTFTVIRMPILWLDTTPIGDMLKRFTVDTIMLDNSVLDTLSGSVKCFVKLIIVVTFGLFASKYTSVLAVALLTWCARISNSYIKARSTVKRADAIPTSDILEHFTTSAAGLSTIRAFGAIDKTVEQMHVYLDNLSKARRHFWIFNRWLGLQMSFVGILFSIGIGIILLSSKSIIDTSLLGFSLTFSMGFSQAIFKAVNNFGHLETAMDAAAAIAEYVELQMEEQGGNEVPEDWPSKGEIEVRGLDVAYSADLPLVLKDLSFTAEASKRIGVVGRTGAGKSSLALSLLRLIEPRRGSILIDGIDISTIKLQDLRTRIGFIPQDPVLFSGTVRSNLDYFKQIPEEQLIRALRRVKLSADEGDEKAGSFTLDSPIGESGSNMSQGQRQLLCLARVLLKKPMITILDEATSAVDYKTDLLIQDTIKKEFTGTLIVVTHRLRTIAGFDQVIVMSDGKVVEDGSPGELLLEKRSMFCDLVMNSQDKEFFFP